jgi:hypothetical protein
MKLGVGPSDTEAAGDPDDIRRFVRSGPRYGLLTI